MRDVNVEKNQKKSDFEVLKISKFRILRTSSSIFAFMI